mmetsp:Transcript_27618/g.49014  ORF Transcript_27618/g.49014 Transcript_27618/m.49014 type:complete len:291 (+) Transcript_27618:1743-2615(+)
MHWHERSCVGRIRFGQTLAFVLNETEGSTPSKDNLLWSSRKLENGINRFSWVNEARVDRILESRLNSHLSVSNNNLVTSSNRTSKFFQKLEETNESRGFEPSSCTMELGVVNHHQRLCECQAITRRCVQQIGWEHLLGLFSPVWFRCREGLLHFHLVLGRGDDNLVLGCGLLLVLDVAVLLAFISLWAFSAGCSTWTTNQLLSIIAKRTSGIPNGTISCTTTEVPIHVLFDFLGAAVICVQGINRDNDSRSTKSALGTMHLNHSLLNRMKIVTLDASNSFDGGDMAAICS